MRRLMQLVMYGLFVTVVPALADGTNVTAVSPGTLAWSSSGVPPGIAVAVVSGDPSKPGPYVIRVKFAPNTAFPLHTHPSAENLTVLSGTFGIGFDPKLDKSKGHELGAGSFIVIPPNTSHFAWSGDRETIVQLHGTGPYVTTPVVADKQ